MFCKEHNYLINFYYGSHRTISKLPQNYWKNLRIDFRIGGINYYERKNKNVYGAFAFYD